MLVPFLVCLLLSPSPDGASTDWNQFRGPGGIGCAEQWRLPMDGPATGGLTTAHWAWKVPLGVEGHSSPVTHADAVYLTGVRGGGARELQCRAIEDGSLRWTHEDSFVPEPQHQLNSAASSTPATDDDHVYVAWTDGGALRLFAVDHEGASVWSLDLGPYSAQHGSGASPVVVEGTVLLGKDHEGEDSFLVGVDAATGEIRWQRPRTSSRASYATPVVVPDGDGRPLAIFASTSHGLTAVDPATGEVRWEASGDFKQRCVAGPGFADGVLLQCAGSGGGGKESLAVLLDPAEGEVRELYRARRALPYVPAPLGVGSRFVLVADGGIATCIRARSGEPIWQERLEASFFGSPVLVGDSAVIMSKEGELFVLGTGEAFDLQARIPLGEPSFATPAVGDGRLLLRTLSHLIAIRLQDAKKKD